MRGGAGSPLPAAGPPVSCLCHRGRRYGYRGRAGESCKFPSTSPFGSGLFLQPTFNPTLSKKATYVTFLCLSQVQYGRLHDRHIQVRCIYSNKQGNQVSINPAASDPVD